jgi:dynein heavy chain
LNENSKPKLKGEQAPFVVVALQECTRMNALLAFMAKSLEELQKGLAGQLNMTEKMEHLAEALTINQVPGRNPFHTTSWEKLAWASMKNLPNWFADMSKRVSEVGVWVETLVLPFSLWLPGLFNPTAFLTAVNQYTARRNKLALDQMAIETHITTETNPANLNAMPVDGAFVHGLMLEGARWEDPSEAAQHPGSISGYKSAVEGTMCAGQIATSRPKELLTLLPVVYCKAVTVQPAWEPTAVGYIRHESDLYNTPVFLTTFRGPTFVFTASLKTSVDPGKWTLAAVAIVMQSDAV